MEATDKSTDSVSRAAKALEYEMTQVLLQYRKNRKNLLHIEKTVSLEENETVLGDVKISECRIMKLKESEMKWQKLELEEMCLSSEVDAEIPKMVFPITPKIKHVCHVSMEEYGEIKSLMVPDIESIGTVSVVPCGCVTFSTLDEWSFELLKNDMKLKKVMLKEVEKPKFEYAVAKPVVGYENVAKWEFTEPEVLFAEVLNRCTAIIDKVTVDKDSKVMFKKEDVDFDCILKEFETSGISNCNKLFCEIPTNLNEFLPKAEFGEIGDELLKEMGNYTIIRDIEEFTEAFWEALRTEKR